MSASIVIIGGGVAGLAAAQHAAIQGKNVALYEASPHLGGRCRSFEDAVLGRTIDNGNHLIMDANTRVVELLRQLGTTGEFIHSAEATLYFADVERKLGWKQTIGTLPPGAGVGDILGMLRLFLARGGQRVSKLFGRSSALYRNFIAPACLATLNTRPEDASAAMLRDVVMLMLKPGNGRWWQVRSDFGKALIEPLREAVTQRGGTIQTEKRLEGLVAEDDRLCELVFADGERLDVRERRVIFALPSWEIAKLLSQTQVPDDQRGILNVHYAVDTSRIPEDRRLVGIIGGLAHWVFVKDGLISTTTSDAENQPVGALAQEEAAATIWREACLALELGDIPLPAYRVIHEKRATFAATPENLAKRPGGDTEYFNAVLAGDWLHSGVPATLEGAVRSGQDAADTTIRRMGRG